MAKQRKYRYKQDHLLHTLDLLGWTALLVGLLIIAVAVRHLMGVRGFRNDLAAGIAYSEQNYSLTAEVDGGEPVRLVRGESGTLYRLFTGPQLRSTPYPNEYISEMTLRCGDGTTLEVALASDTLLHLRLTAADGKVRTFAMQFNDGNCIADFSIFECTHRFPPFKPLF
ncbi:MAG: hypothetical protein IKV55_05725 [Oscillospiraceae bacterium]|nr:hypothetical protein [Oscillospiraceae bacterium]